MIAKVDQQFGENISAHDGKKTLAYLFQNISQAVCKQLESLKNEEDEEDRGYITAKDFMNDFATEDFLSKNIRVRPLSGVTRNEDDGKTNNDYNKSSTDPHGQTDKDEKDHQEFLLLMEDARRQAKAQRDEVLKKRALEEERAAKKRR